VTSARGLGFDSRDRSSACFSLQGLPSSVLHALLFGAERAKRPKPEGAKVKNEMLRLHAAVIINITLNILHGVLKMSVLVEGHFCSCL
jgi:hypothetical protein